MSRLAEYLGEVALAIQNKEPINLEALQEAAEILQEHLGRVWDAFEQKDLGLESLDQGWRDTLELYQEALDLAVLGAVEPGPDVAERLRFALSEARDQAVDVKQNVEMVSDLLANEDVGS